MTTFGSRRLVVGAHYGLRDWLAQRITSLLMALFTIAVVVQVLLRRQARLLPLVGDLRAAMDEGAGLRHHRLAALSRVGRHARHLDGLRQAGRRSGSRSTSRRSPGWSAAPAGRSRSSGGCDGRAGSAHLGRADAPLRRRHRRRRRLGDAGVAAALACRAQRRRPDQGVPDPLAHGRGARRDRRFARQHERGQLALPLLRHRQGQRLARRPGRDRVHVPRGAERRLRARALRHAVRPQPGRHDLPAPVRRPHRELRREAGAARLRRRRPHRPRDAAHAVPAERQGAHQFLRRVDGARPDPRRRGRRRRRHRARDGDRPAARAAGQGGDARDRRRRPDLRGIDQRLHQHRRRPRHGGARRPAARGHGVLAVPSDRRLRRRRAAHRRLPRRRRDPAQRQRRALHGALRADAEGPRTARLRLALHGPGDQGRARLRCPTRTTSSST